MENVIVILGKYKGVEVPRPNLEVSKEELDHELDRAANLAAKNFEKETEPAESGDQVVIDYKGFLDDKPFAGGEGRDYPLVLGSGIFIPGFEEQLIGTHKGDQIDLKVTFPEDYQAKDLAGKPVVFKVTVKEVRGKIVPELTDEIVQKVSDQKTVEEFKKYVIGEIQKKKAADAAREQEDYAVAKIIEDSEVTIPRGDVETRAKEIRQSMERELQSSGHTLGQYMQYNGLTEEQFNEGLIHDARMMLEGQAVLDEIAKQEGFTYTKEELDKEVSVMADKYKMKESKLRSRMGDKGLQMLGQDILSGKAMDFVMSHIVEID